MPTKKDNKLDLQESISIKEYFNQRLTDLEEKIQTIFDLNKIASDKTETRIDSRLSVLNGFREQANEFVTKTEFTTCMKEVNANIKSLELNRATLEGKASQKALTVTTIIAFLGLLVGCVGLISKIPF